MTKNLAIFASGNGSNAENICYFFKKSSDINVVLICSNNKNAYVVKIAKKLDIPLFLFTKKGLENFFKLKNILKKNRIDFIILAGFLLKIPKKLLKNYPNKVINIHPALLPKYGGKGMYGNNVHKAVLEKKETESGITIHFVNSKYDDGEIIFPKHHESHAASAFFASPFDKAAFITMDGVGEWSTASYGLGEINTIQLKMNANTPG